MQYTVQMADGSSTRIVSDQREIKVNDCVAIERVGNSANIRRAAADYCDPANTQAVSEVSDANKSEAVHCQNAKDELAVERISRHWTWPFVKSSCCATTDRLAGRR